MSGQKRFIQRLAYGIRNPESELTRLQRFVRDGYFFARHTAARLRRHHAPQLASALSYRTLFSLIPLLALSLVMVRGFYGEEGIRTGLRAVMDFTGVSQIAIVADESDARPGGAGSGSGSASDGEIEGVERDPIVTREAIAPLGRVDRLGTPLSPLPTTFTFAKRNMDGTLARPPTPSLQQRREQAVSVWIEEFVDNAVARVSGINLRWITLVAIGVFIYAAISLLIQIEESFNAVCNAQSGRAIVTRVTNYWTMLTLGSVAIFASFVVGDAYARLLAQVPDWLGFVKAPMSLVTQVGASWLLLLFAYTQMPNARVRVKYAAIGAIVAAIFWEMGKGGLSWFVTEMTGGQVAVYGALALLPLFLLWVYITWLIVLFGLELSHSIQTVGPERREQASRQSESPTIDPLVGIAALRVIARDFEAGSTASQEGIASRLSLPEHTAARVVRALVDDGIVLRTLRGADDEGLTLAMPPERIRLADVASRVFPLNLNLDAGDGVVSLRDRTLKAWGDITLGELVHDESVIEVDPPEETVAGVASTATRIRAARGGDGGLGTETGATRASVEGPA